MRGHAGRLGRGLAVSARAAASALGVLVVAAQADQARHAIDRACRSSRRLASAGFGRLRREQAAEQAAAARLRGRLAAASGLGNGHLGRRRPRRAAGAGAAPATTGASASSGMRGGRTVAGMVPGGVETNRKASCGATPIWFFFTASTNTGCMPPSALVLIGASGDVAAAQIGDLDLVLALLVAHRAGDLFRHFVRRALAGRAERQRATSRPAPAASNT